MREEEIKKVLIYQNQLIVYNKIYSLTQKLSMCIPRNPLPRAQHLKSTAHQTPKHKQKPAQYQANKNNLLPTQQSPTTQAHSNKLPINLFYSAAQYNKILITNGRSLRKNSQPQIPDYVSNLEFINEPIFQSCEQKKQKIKEKQKNVQVSLTGSDRKKISSFGLDCGCCCCDQFCKICAKDHAVGIQRKITSGQLQRKLDQINSLPLKGKHKAKKKIITSETNIKSNHLNFNLKTQKKSKQIQNSQKQASSSYLSHKSFHINNLLYKSLLQFEQKKRQNKIRKIQEKKTRLQHEHLMRQYEEQIRKRNKQMLSKEKSPVKRNRSANSYKIRVGYWQSIKDAVAKEIRKDNLSKSRNKSNEKLSKSAIQCTHQVRISPEMIQLLRVKRQQQAKEKIAKQAQQIDIKKKKIQKHLRQLQKHRRHHLQTCEKKKFQPSPQMIEQAFKNIVEEPKLVPQQLNKSKGNKIKS